MDSSNGNSEHGHLTLGLKMKSTADGQALRAKLPGVLPAFAMAADAVGALHYYRLIALDDTNFLFICEYDGELEAILRAMASQVRRDFRRHLRPCRCAAAACRWLTTPTPSSSGPPRIRSAHSRSTRRIRA